jgi:hypothetical protein
LLLESLAHLEVLAHAGPKGESVLQGRNAARGILGKRRFELVEEQPEIEDLEGDLRLRGRQDAGEELALLGFL